MAATTRRLTTTTTPDADATAASASVERCLNKFETIGRLELLVVLRFLSWSRVDWGFGSPPDVRLTGPKRLCCGGDRYQGEEL